jgi:hypothetical protein
MVMIEDLSLLGWWRADMRAISQAVVDLGPRVAVAPRGGEPTPTGLGQKVRVHTRAMESDEVEMHAM